MAKDTKSMAGRLTMELPGFRGTPGRPPTGKAKTAAQRQAEYRDRKTTALAQAAAPLANTPPATLARRLANHLVAAYHGSPVQMGGDAEEAARIEWAAIGQKMGWL